MKREIIGLNSKMFKDFGWSYNDRLFITDSATAMKRIKHFKYQLQELVHCITHLYYEDVEYAVNGYSYQYVAEYASDLVKRMNAGGALEAFEDMKCRGAYEVACEFIDYMNNAELEDWTVDTAKSAFYDTYSEEALHEVFLTMVAVRNFINEYFYHIDMFDLDGTGGLDVYHIYAENKKKRFMRSEWIICDLAETLNDYGVISL